MKPINMIAIVVIALITATAAGASAQTARGPVIDDLTSQRSLVQSGSNCIGQIQVNCGAVPAPPQCQQTVVQCSNTYVNCRNTGGVTAAWVMRQIKRALNNYASKADLEALRREMQAKDADLQAQIDALKDDLKKNWEDHAKIRTELKKHTDAACHDGERRCVNESTAEFCVNGQWANQTKCAADQYCNDGLCMAKDKQGWKVGPVVGAGLIVTSGPKVVTADIGIRLESDKAVVTAKGGAGADFNGHAAVKAEASVEYRATEVFNVGATVVYAHGRLDDKGQVALGAGPKISVAAPDSWKVRPEVSLFGGIAAVTQYKKGAVDPATGDRTSKLGWKAGYMVGLSAEFSF